MPDAYTKLLLHCDGADESTDIIDSGVTDHEITAVGTAMLDTAWKEFGTASLEVDGNSDFITAPDHADWNFTANFTLDFVVKHAAVGKRQTYFNQYETNSREWSFELDVNNKILIWHYYSGTEVNIRTTNAAITDTNKHHVAIVRSGNTCYIFVDGVSQALTTTTAFSGALTDISSILRVGANYYNSTLQAFVDGHMDEIRVSKGIARWTSNFTPPNAAYDSALIEPSTLTAEATLQAPSLSIGATVTPVVLSALGTLQTPSLCFDRTVFPTTLQGLATLQTPVTIHIQHPGSFSALATLHAPTIIFDCTITPTTLAALATLHAPTVALDATILPTTLAALATLHAPAISIFYTTIPPFILEDLISPYSGGAWLWLVEVAVPGYDVVCIAKNTEKVIYGAHTFPRGNFAVGKQSLSGDGTIPRIALRIAHDDTHQLEALMNATRGMENGTVKIIRTCEKFLETPVQDLEAIYQVLTAGSDSEWIALSLGIPNPLTLKIPRDFYSSSICPLATPSLFKGVRCRYTGEDTICTGLLEDCFTKGNSQHWGAEVGLDPSSIRI